MSVAVKHSWERRYKYLLAVTAYTKIMIAYIIIKKIDTSPAEAFVTAGCLLIAACVGSYVFGAVWDDKR